MKNQLSFRDGFNFGCGFCFAVLAFAVFASPLIAIAGAILSFVLMGPVR